MTIENGLVEGIARGMAPLVGRRARMERLMRVDVAGCARCGGEHKGLEFKRLDRPADEWQWWAACPANGQPVMMKVVEEGPQQEEAPDGVRP